MVRRKGIEGLNEDEVEAGEDSRESGREAGRETGRAVREEEEKVEEEDEEKEEQDAMIGSQHQGLFCCFYRWFEFIPTNLGLG